MEPVDPIAQVKNILDNYTVAELKEAISLKAARGMELAETIASARRGRLNRNVPRREIPASTSRHREDT